MQTLKQWAGAAVAAIALGGFCSPAAADAPGPNYQAAPQYSPAPVRPVYPYARPPVVYGYPAPPPPVVYYDPAPPVVVYPRRYRYVTGRYVYSGYPYLRQHGARYFAPRHFGSYGRGYAWRGHFRHR